MAGYRGEKCLFVSVNVCLYACGRLPWQIGRTVVKHLYVKDKNEECVGGGMYVCVFA